ncbi:SigE family RNA polymerase sigma factor [Micromonospora eburnea]|uniref:RNA polymerase sigma-70 factor, ECF subfamily n=1 Tax=Micromonospora eburnea TaxID=227316 RepID=A0A1C6VJJ8_9ACTN|nr:SigE family RNA polymerase sigma factor [Micromonospora eburnea]SCL66471.1 RNA polymerase sigma-70 factor, ECF subfamily [Micromonospora eburnea]
MTMTGEPQLGVPPPAGTAERTEESEGIDFDRLYHAHFRSLTLQLVAYCGDLSQAQDLVQEAFCRAFARWSRVSRYDDPLAWIRRVAWNLATSRWRRLRTAQSWLRRQRVEHVPGPGPDRVALTAALAMLPARHRRAVVLHYLADLSVTQIAEQEGVPEGTVKSWLHRGRVSLAEQLAGTNEVNDK